MSQLGKASPFSDWATTIWASDSWGHSVKIVSIYMLQAYILCTKACKGIFPEIVYLHVETKHV